MSIHLGPFYLSKEMIGNVPLALTMTKIKLLQLSLVELGEQYLPLALPSS
jgi:hypothetical protein